MRKYNPELLMVLVIALSITVLACAGTPTAATDEPELIAEETRLEQSFDEACVIRLLVGETVQELTLHDYLIGVVLSELPGSFEPEAMKAQAVASRTYALHCAKHEQADVCANSGCCQCWKESADSPYYEKVCEAVAATDGLVLAYEGKLIDATFFSCSGGTTEDAVAVWGSDVPYLQSVESPGEEAAACYHSQVTVTPQAFSEKLPDANLSGEAGKWVMQTRKSEGGGIASITIGEALYTGTELRRIFGLKSAKFELTYLDGQFVFDVYGYGHRVGMSQYGAQAMAKQGAGYVEILHTYYTDIEIVQAEKIASP